MITTDEASNLIENPPPGGFDVFGTVSDQVGFNLIGRQEGSDGWDATTLRGTADNPKDPGLDPNGLADNGGVTKTISVLTTGLAYRAGDPTLAGSTDQRGYTRRVDLATGLRVTIGAYDNDALAP